MDTPAMTGSEARAPCAYTPAERVPALSIAIVSGAALGYELLLMRLFSIEHWHHFAYMVISLALLGFGVSGSLLTVLRRRLLRHFPAALLGNLALFGLACIACTLLAQRVPFNSLEVLWTSEQWGRLLRVYLLLFVPFLFAANAIGLTFARYPVQVGRTYAYDLVGAGLGSVAVIGLLYWVGHLMALRLIGVLGLLAALVASWEVRASARWARPGLVLLVVAVLLAPNELFTRPVSPYKGLSQTLRLPEARVIVERSSPLGLVSVVESPRVPLRLAPGLSLNSRASIPEQLGLFVDGEGPSPITRYTGGREALAYLGDLTSALPYRLAPTPRVLIAGTRGSDTILQAIYLKARRVDVAEINPDLRALLSRDLAEFSGWTRLQGQVHLHDAHVRAYLGRHAGRYDLINLDLSARRAGALAQDFRLTREAIAEMLDHLAPGGRLAISGPLRIPPQDPLRLVTTAPLAPAQLAARLALVRGWGSYTLVIAQAPLGRTQIRDLRSFAESRAFDVGYYPGMTRAEGNRYNLLRGPAFFDGVTALLGPRAEDFRARYKFDLRPATDDRPYFYNGFRWSSAGELLALRDRGGLPLLDWGYPVLVATLAQAVLLSLILILGPLALLRSDRAWAAPRAAPVMAYFLLIGTGFMFLEIALIQRLTLFLHHPLYAAATVLAGLLVFAGLGSRLAQARVDRLSGRDPPSQRVPAWAAALLSLVYLALLPVLFGGLMALPLAVKVLVCLLAIAPLGLLLGMPFPLGLARLASDRAALVPWAWGINGCASVISAVLATLVAVHLGFTAVVLTAATLYLSAGLVRP